MQIKWVLLLAISLCSIQPCIAQPVTHHKKASEHKRVTRHTNPKHVNKHKTTHRAKSTNKHHSASTNSSPQTEDKGINKKLVSLDIPQPQFDTTYNINNTNNTNYSIEPSANWQNINAADTDNSDNAVNTSSVKLTNLAYKTVETLRFSSYKLGGTTFDPTQGIYKIDCSTYINDLLSETNPHAYSTLTNWTQTYKPTTADYYNFIKKLPTDATADYWHKINNVGQLQPGGILVFRNISYNKKHAIGGGHVMIVMSKPIPHPSATDIYQVKVADSASSGHSYDTRSPHQSGIGIGTLLLKVDPNTGRPSAYAWRLDDHWRSNALFAMAQPVSAA